MSYEEICPRRIEPVKIGKTLTKADLEKIVVTMGAIEHLTGCIVIALTRKFDTRELAAELHKCVDELAGIGTKKSCQE